MFRSGDNRLVIIRVPLHMVERDHRDCDENGDAPNISIVIRAETPKLAFVASIILLRVRTYPWRFYKLISRMKAGVNNADRNFRSILGKFSVRALYLIDNRCQMAADHRVGQTYVILR